MAYLLLSLLLLTARADDGETLDGAAGVPAVGTEKKVTTIDFEPEVIDRERGARLAVDWVLESYGACYGVDHRLLKAIAKAESGLNPWKVTGKYHGLFQLDTEACNDNLKLSFLSCSNLDDPETSTAAGTYRFGKLIKRIEKACPGADLRDMVMMIYVGHNNGPTVLNYLLDNKLCKAVTPTSGSTPDGQEKGVRDWTRNHSTKTKFFLSYREEAASPVTPKGAKGSCRTGFKKGNATVKRPPECYVKVAPACQGRRQLDLYERGIPNKVALKAECKPGEDGVYAEVNTYGTIDEGWAAEKWWVGDGIHRGLAAAGATSVSVPVDAKLCPTARLYPADKLEQVFPKNVKY